MFYVVFISFLFLIFVNVLYKVGLSGHCYVTIIILDQNGLK